MCFVLFVSFSPVAFERAPQFEKGDAIGERGVWATAGYHSNGLCLLRKAGSAGATE